mgnify:CR=1 FL=1
MDRQILLTTDELAVAFLLCGYEALSNQILLNEEMLQSEEMFDYFVRSIEDSMNLKGYWNDGRDTLLVEGVEEIIRLLALSQKKIRFVTGTKVNFLHKLINEKYLLQVIENGVHTLAYVDADFKLEELVKRIVKIKETDIKHNSWQPLLFNSETFDEFHSQSPKELHKLSTNEAIGPELKCFIKDLIDNNQEFDNVSCMVMDTNSDVMQVVDVLFYLSGRNNVWYVDYEQVEEDKIFIVPETYKKFIDDINKWLAVFF